MNLFAYDARWHGWRYAMREWWDRLVCRWVLMPLAHRLDRREDVCWADACTDLGLGRDLGRFWHEGLESLNGGGLRCQDDARKDGMCYCGKMRCATTMRERGFTDGMEPADGLVFVEPAALRADSLAGE